jgi:DNA polymerase
MLYIDFETRSPVDIWTTGAWNYAKDRRTEVLCMAYASDDADVKLWLPGMTCPAEVLDAIALCEGVEAHNAFFERCVWQHIMVPRFNFPRIPDELWHCSMAKCSARGLPKALDQAAYVLQAGQYKDTKGAAVMRKLAKSSDVPYNKLLIDHAEMLQDLYDYCRQDVRTERAIAKKLPNLSVTERRVWLLDQTINQRGVQIDTDAVDKALPVLEQYQNMLNKELFTLTGGEVTAATQRNAMLQWLRKNGLPCVDKLTKLHVQEWLKLPDLPQDVRDVLQVRVDLGKTSVAKYQMFKTATDVNDHRLRDILVYCGAGATGRWAGKLVQLQNLPADRSGKFDIDAAVEMLKSNPDEFEIWYPDVAQALSYCLRGMIISAPGKDLLVADYATIEVRVLAWLAGEDRLLNAFHAGQDVYLDMASAIYGGKKFTKADKFERQLGKQAVLGCGYGMGPDKFWRTCGLYGMNIPQDLAQRAVYTYRNTYSKVPTYWRTIENMFCTVLDNPKGSPVQTNDGKIAMGWFRDWLCVRLPSGRSLSYFQPAMTDEGITYRAVNSTTHQWDYVKTYGGKLVENITQAVARDIMAQAMLRCEAGKYPVVLSVHDEIVSEVPEGQGSVEDFLKQVTALPDWARGCPITAEGWRGKRYKK